jgi:transposase-like protein
MRKLPTEFRCDVAAVGRQDEALIAQVARDFGVSESCLAPWLTLPVGWRLRDSPDNEEGHVVRVRLVVQ